ncbi:MAG TPA: hypothetical protein VFT50_12125 [Baekduia sp.]|nr:hypothetical protein [Baekduia sp.]
MSMLDLGADTAGLAPLPRAFLAGLGALLDELRPARLDAGITKATRRDDGVEVVLAHAHEPAWSIWAQAARDGVLVGCGALHAEHTRAGDALALVADLLGGRREVPGYAGARLRPDFR